MLGTTILGNTHITSQIIGFHVSHLDRNLSTPIRKESSTDARLIIAAAVCDGLDGHVARRWSYSGMGHIALG